jgi:16S rRNA (cytidine1402-2'-O)-methyltransferase
MLALMASGLNGQQFRFHGYLPVQDDDRKKWIAKSEKTSIEIAKAEKKPATGQAVMCEAQIAIETPYRNQALFDALLKTLSPSTQLCLATDITGPAEMIHTKTIADWRDKPLALEKIPTIFLWQAIQ